MSHVPSWARVIGLVLAVMPAAGAVDRELLELIMPNARIVVGADLSRIQSSPMGEVLRTGLQAGMRQAEGGPQLQMLFNQLGFDPLLDIQEILFASTGGGQNPPALVVIRGSAKLRGLMERFPGRTHSGKTDLASIGDLLITGDAALVRAARLRRGHGPSMSATMAKRISDMSARYDLWVLSSMGFSSFAGSANQAKTPATPMNDALKSIEQFSVGLGLSGDFLLNVEVVARDVTAAQSLGSTAQMALAMATQNVAKDPSTQAALQRMKFVVEGRTLRLSITVPAEEMQKQMAMMKAQAQSGAFGNGLGLGPGVAASGRANGDKSSKVPPNADLVITSSPKDMGTVVISGSKK